MTPRCIAMEKLDQTAEHARVLMAALGDAVATRSQDVTPIRRGHL